MKEMEEILELDSKGLSKIKSLAKLMKAEGITSVKIKDVEILVDLRYNSTISLPKAAVEAAPLDDEQFDPKNFDIVPE